MALTREQLVVNAWRRHIVSYAIHMSHGHWKPYRWITAVLTYVEEKIREGNAYIIILAPPQHGKSEGISHWLSSWFINTWPDRKVILTSYSDTRAARWGLAVRGDHLNNDESWVKIQPAASSVREWITTEGGGMRSAGTGGSVTSLGCDLLIIDDPVKDWEEAYSPVYRERWQNFFKSVLATRKAPRCSTVFIMTRWTEDDPAGYLMNETDITWDVLRLPAICEDEGEDPLGRTEGEALCPESGKDVIWLAEKRKEVGEAVWAGLYQQRPSPLEGGIIQKAWIKRYSEGPEKFDELCQSWDLTFKKEGTSFVVGGVIGRKDGNFYLVAADRGKKSFTDACDDILLMSRTHPKACTKLIESAANGEATVDALQGKIPGIVLVKPSGSKVERLSAVSGLFQAGNVWFPTKEIAGFDVEYFIHELTTFPNGAHDDVVDMLSMGLKYLSEKNGYITSFDLPTAGKQVNPWVY